MPTLSYLFILSTLFIFLTAAQNFTIKNGQIYTPGLAIVDSPQPNTPEGGDTLQVALDVSGNGQLSLDTYDSDATTQFYNITIFLTSTSLENNFTINNGTPSIIEQESGSTVKHVNFFWPKCLAGEGTSGDRGEYNVDSTLYPSSYQITNL
ncbi:MAG: hypothetical protein M1834_005810 [Cirrosporium novae-zelandiae]|nr:MAG: hypothetical protein M1834_005810 [Cirrosporium novae-zelandiae]